MAKFPFFFPVFLGFFMLGCQPGDQSTKEPLKVAVAANVQFAMEELESMFESETGIPVDVVLSSSGKLAAQIRQGAPYDLFVSADMKFPAYLFEEGKAVAEPSVYAYGILVLWTLKEADLSAGVSGLTAPAVQKIAIPNPKTAPYGEQAMRALEHYGLAESLRDRLVFGESIATANQYILSRACEVGFTARSVVEAPELKGMGNWVAVDPEAYEAIAQGVVITRHGQEVHPEASVKFFEFLFSEKGRGIFQKFGYQLPE